ncbi:MAG TPA: hypothetical protein VMF89_24920, partial [Polyangiales bacterium]|nr:hypothetical protein [Polyangiales bacterium]
ICLLKVPSLPLPSEGPVRVEKLDDSVLLHTTLDFADDPEDLAGAVRSLLGEPVADQHDDERGIFLIPSVAAPKARSYAGVIEEVADGGVWASWEPAEPAEDEGGVAGLPLTAAGGPELAGLLGSMLGGMPPGMLAQAAASLREDPSALQDAAAQLPGLLQNPSQMPELAGMLQAMGVSGSQLSDITRGLQEQLARDPSELIAMAEGLFGAAGETHDDDDEDEKA